VLDTSSGTSFESTWRECMGLTSFPALNISSASPQGFDRTWYDCRSLASFPLLDFSGVTYFRSTWYNCS
jgi:hypothetical protein